MLDYRMAAIVIALAICVIPAHAQYDSPLKQFRSGLSISQILCRQGLELVLKTTSQTPACVRPDTADRLTELGWATPVLSWVDNMQDQKTDTPDANRKTITLDDNNKPITLHVGQGFLLKLGETYNWDIQIDNQMVVSRVMNMMVIRGAQGLYDAHAPGNATLTAVGDPQCRSETPACMMPSILFELHITVQ